VASLRPGDSISCKISYDLLVFAESHLFNSIVTFDIICPYENGYLIKVPTYIRLKTSFEATADKIKKYSIPKNFIYAEVQFITEKHIFTVSDRRDGECCDKCGDFFPMSEKNEEGTFLCFLCKTYKYR